MPVLSYVHHLFNAGFDHGVGHSLLLLYDAQAPKCQKSSYFKDLDNHLSNTILSGSCWIPGSWMCRWRTTRLWSCSHP